MSPSQCAACHAPIPDGARFCPACATPIDDSRSGQDQLKTVIDTNPATRTSSGSVTGFPTQASLVSGAVIDGKYEVREKLGTGGFGDVYRVHHLILKRDLALKTLHPLLVHNPQVRERFFREARVLMDLSHPNIVTMREVGEWSGHLYLVMDFCPGETLHAILKRRGRLPASSAAALAIPALRALDYAHAQGVVHRDLKPANLMITPGVGKGKSDLKVLDFGVAKVLTERPTQTGEEGALTATGVAIGTLHYMSPEQAGGGTPSGGGIDGRSDLYSLGVVLYETVTGRRPFDGENNTQVYKKIILDPPPGFQAVGVADELPGFEKLILQCLEKEPAARPASARAMIARLDALLSARSRASTITLAKTLGPAGALPASPRMAIWGVAALLVILPGVLWGLGLLGRTPPSVVNTANQAPSANLPAPTNEPEKGGTGGPVQTPPRPEYPDLEYAVDVENPTLPPPLPAAWGEEGARYNAAREQYPQEPGKALEILINLETSAPPGVSSWATAALFVDRLRNDTSVRAREIMNRLERQHPDAAITRSMRQLLKGALEARNRKLWDTVKADVEKTLPGEPLPPEPSPYRVGKSIVRKYIENHQVGPARDDADAFLKELEEREARAVAAAYDAALQDAREKWKVEDVNGTLAAAARALAFRRDSVEAMDLKNAANSRAHAPVVLSLPDKVFAIAFSPDGKLLAAACEDKRVHLFDPATGKELRMLSGHTGAVKCLAFGDQGRTLITGSADTTIRVWNTDTGKESRKLSGHTKEVNLLVVSRDGHTIASGSLDCTLRLWQSDTGKVDRVLGPHAEPVAALDFTSDGGLLAFAGADKKIKLYDVAGGRPMRVANELPASPTVLLYLRQPRKLVLGSREGKFFLLEAPGAKVLEQIPAHGKAILAMAFYADGKLLATAGEDQVVKVWDSGTWKERLTLKGHTDAVQSLSFSPDGKLLASGSLDKTVRIWKIEP